MLEQHLILTKRTLFIKKGDYPCSNLFLKVLTENSLLIVFHKMWQSPKVRCTFCLGFDLLHKQFQTKKKKKENRKKVISFMDEQTDKRMAWLVNRAKVIRSCSRTRVWKLFQASLCYLCYMLSFPHLFGSMKKLCLLVGLLSITLSELNQKSHKH